ncbi:hypothetical protein BS78_03G183100 [Paspalum vaginatum]|nr:hypothetical protein BS78_03G183100 [Paspalum vaginatum]
MFQAAYGREIEPLTDKSKWLEVHLPFSVCAPLTKRKVGRQRKLRFKSCLEGGHRKKGANDVSDDNNNVDGNPVEQTADNSAPTNAKGKKMIRGPVTCKRCGEKGHRQASYKCPLNGTKKRKRKPRKNTTKQGKDSVTTPQMLIREQILRDSPGRMTRSRLAFLFGKDTSSQPATSSQTANV